MKQFLISAAVAVSFTLPAAAQTSHDSHHVADKASGNVQPAQLTDGEIRRVDKDAKKLTIRHGRLEKLDMPPMTMVFQVKDPALLDQVKVGDKVRFDAEKVGGAYLVTKIEPAN
jgi:Cu(I)/Ag(I) efflux system periplasmic protein CusF